MLVKSLLGSALLGAAFVSADDSTQPMEAGSGNKSGQCNCYLVSGADPGYFQYHRFWDFRDIPNESDGNDYINAPPLIVSSENTGGQTQTSSYFNSTQFNTDWSIQNDIETADSAVPSVNSAQNIFISRKSVTDGNDSTYLALRASRLDSFASCAEIDSNQKNVLHSSIRARMRVMPNFPNNPISFADDGVSISSIDDLKVAPGAVLGLFTYESDTQESDMEILTSDPTTNVRYSNQPDYDAKTGNTVPGASTEIVLPDNKIWTDWHDHRIDWYDGVSRWYIDDKLVLEKTLNVPTKPSGLVLNLWSDGGEWSGNMSVGAQVVAGVEWIEMAFNISGKSPTKRHEGTCNIGCNIDGATVGVPEVAFNATGSGNGVGGRATMVASGHAVQAVIFFWLASLVGLV